MSARIGADDLAEFGSPRTRLLREVSGLEPQGEGFHVLLQTLGVRSAQRLAIGDAGGVVTVALWPAELKPQAEFLYSDDRGYSMVAAARTCGWTVDPSPHLAFFTAPPAGRLYMRPATPAEEYVARWTRGDLRWVGQYSRDDVRAILWPWLKGRGYASDADDLMLEQFLAGLRNRKAHLRPGLRIKRRWSETDVPRHEFAAIVRDQVDAILTAAGDPALPGA